MSDKKHIDRLFQEKFKDFEVLPDDAIWDRIEAQLSQKKKRRFIPIWWQIGGVAASLVLLFALGFQLLDSEVDTPAVVDTKSNTPIINNQNFDKDTDDSLNNNSKNNVVDTDLKKTSQEDDNVTSPLKTKTTNQSPIKNSINSKVASIQSEPIKKTPSVEKQVKNTNVQVTPSVVSNNKRRTEKSNGLQLKSKSEIDQLITEKGSNVVTTTPSESEDLKEKPLDADNSNTSDIKKKEQTIEEAIAEANPNNEEEKLRRWSIAPSVAPVFFNSLGEGSAIGEQFATNTTNSDVSMSYGLKGSYAVNKRLKITTGVHRVNLNNTTNNVIALADNSLATVTPLNANNSSINTTSTVSGLENITLANGIDPSALIIISRSSLRSSIPETVNTLPDGSLEQRFGFIEIPLEIEYRVIDRKLGVNVMGGFSTLFLNENEIYADINGENTMIGEANNIQDTSFSANFGIGLNYSLSKTTTINLEPKFKYQINTFNNTTGDFQPFFIGVYTGLSFKF